MICIFLNSICLAVYDYKDGDSETRYNKVLDRIGEAFSIIFAIESLLKVLAQGFVLSKKSYLRDPWNILDFIIVLAGLLDFFKDVFVGLTIDIKSLRILRALRPLRSINAVPRMKRLVKTLLKSVPQLVNVTVFLLFMYLLFSIMGL